MECILRDGLVCPLVGVGTAAAVYLGWLLLSRVLPPAFRLAHGFWIVISVMSGFVGWWAAPREVRFAQEERDLWLSRRQVLVARQEWQAFAAAWRSVTEVSATMVPYGPRPGQLEEAVPRLEGQLQASLAGLRNLQRSGLLTATERGALESLASQRVIWLYMQRPDRKEPLPWEACIARLESRYGLLARFMDDPDADVLWQQRALLARELGGLQALLNTSSGCPDRAAQKAEMPLPAFEALSPEVRSVALLAAELSSPPTDSSSCGVAASSSCAPEPSFCGAARAAASTCGPRPATGCCP